VKTLNTLLLLLCIIPFTVVMAENNAGAFVERAHSPRVTALGYSFVGLADDGSSLYANPAGLSLAPKFSFQVMSFEAFETDYTNVMMNFRRNKLTFGMGIITAEVTGIEETTASQFISGTYVKTGALLDYNARASYVGLSYKATDSLSVGTAVKFVREEIYNYGSGGGMGLDLGVLKNFKRHRVGFSILNIVPTPIQWDGVEEKMPRIVKIGSSSRFFDDNLTVSVESESKESRDMAMHLGAELWVIPIAAVRMGIDAGEFSVGTGLKLGALKMNMSFTHLDDFIDDVIYKFEIGYDIVPKKRRPIDPEDREEYNFKPVYTQVDNSIPVVEKEYFPSPRFKLDLPQTITLSKADSIFTFKGSGEYIETLYIDNVSVEINEDNTFVYTKTISQKEDFVVKFRVYGKDGTKQTFTRFFVRK
jgi:hypothetical protein